jgi:hypothetical protein
VDRVYLYDNSVDFQEPKLLFRVVDGLIAKEYGSVNNWAMPVFEFIKNND